MITLALLLAAPVRLTVDVPTQVRSGEPVTVVVVAENVTDKPITLVRAQPTNYRLGFGWKADLTRDGKTVARDERSPLRAQTVYRAKIGPEPFVTLPPRQRMELYREQFQQSYLADAPNLKRALADAPKSPLAPGRYEWSFEYRFEPSFAQHQRKEAARGRYFRPYLTPEAEALYRSAWKGSVTASATIEILPSGS